MIFESNQFCIVKEHTSAKYGPRTKENADNADLTVAFAADSTTGGEILTKRYAGQKYIGIDILTRDTHGAAIEIFQYIQEHVVTTINVAGNGLQTLSRFDIDQSLIDEYIFQVFKALNSLQSISTIICGGQTGADIAGAKAARKLKISYIVTMPKGYIQRTSDGIDRNMTREEILKQINAV